MHDAPDLRLSVPSGLALGIDPGQKTGLALYLPAGSRLLVAASAEPVAALDFLAACAEDAAAAVRSLAQRGHRLPDWTTRRVSEPAEEGHPEAGRFGLDPLAFVVIEDARRLPLYDRHRKADRGTRDRIARSVGRIDGLTDMLEWKCKELGLPLYLDEPSRRPKWDDAHFRRVTGYELPTNEHARDAARLVYGHTPAQLRRLCGVGAEGEPFVRSTEGVGEGVA